MAADHLTSALDALVSHLQTALDAATGSAGAVPCYRGFRDDRAGAPEKRADVAVQAGQPIRRPHAPVDLGVSSGVRRWGVAEWAANVQLDVMADKRQLRDELVQAVGGALVALPDEGGLTLTVSAYYGQRVRFRVTGDVPDEPGEDQPLTGPWGHIIEIRATGTVVVAEADPDADLVRAEVTYIDAGSGDESTTSVT